MQGSKGEQPSQFHKNTTSQHAETIRHLQDELDETRQIVIDLMPEEVQTVLGGYYSCGSSKDTVHWQVTAVAKIIALAKVLPRGLIYDSDRAYCPLCGDGTSARHYDGFTVPEGLDRHLFGRGNGERCPVFGVTMRLARDFWHERFYEREKAQKLARQLSETLYKTSPYQSPQLVDEGLYGTSRSVEDLTWAEGRLTILGFEIINEANVRSYISDLDQFVVYADPRPKGEIRFTVHSKPLSRYGPKHPIGFLSLRDRCKNDIRGKYIARLPLALQETARTSLQK